MNWGLKCPAAGSVEINTAFGDGKGEVRTTTTCWLLVVHQDIAQVFIPSLLHSNPAKSNVFFFLSHGYKEA